MKKINLDITIQEWQLEELSVDDQDLIRASIEATNHAYANYSHFYVGAAVRLANGKIVIGANQENAAFPSGLCAERTAVFAAQANFPKNQYLHLPLRQKMTRGCLPNPLHLVALVGK